MIKLHFFLSDLLFVIKVKEVFNYNLLGLVNMKAFCNVREEAYKPNKSYIMMPIVTQSDFITTPQHQVLSHFSLPVPLASPGLVLLDFVVYILPDPERVHGQIYLTRVT